MPSLRSLCEDAIGFRVPESDFLESVQAMDIFRRSLTREQRREILHSCNTPFVVVKHSEDRIQPVLCVEKNGHVRMRLNTWLHGKRSLQHIIPTKSILKAHKANQVAKIKGLLDTTDISQEQITSLLKVLRG